MTAPAKTQVTTRSSVTSRVRSIKTVLWVVLILNLAVALAKFVWGVISGSASMQADGIHSIFDSAGNVVGIVGITLASRPADTDHPYGHAKFETYSSMIIGVMLLIAAFEVGSNAIGALTSGTYGAQVSVVSFCVMIGTLIINSTVTIYERHMGHKYSSDILLADASHTLSDAFVSIGVIFGLILVACGIPQADPIMALFVTVAILYTAWNVFRRGLVTLSDKARIPEEEIFSSINTLDDVKGAHQIRTRGTEGEVYVDLHVVVDPSLSVMQAHNLCETIEAQLKSRFPQICEVLVHIEPDDGRLLAPTDMHPRD